jgi:hypothetical protein
VGNGLHRVNQRRSVFETFRLPKRFERHYTKLLLILVTEYDTFVHGFSPFYLASKSAKPSILDDYSLVHPVLLFVVRFSN